MQMLDDHQVDAMGNLKQAMGRVKAWLRKQLQGEPLEGGEGDGAADQAADSSTSTLVDVPSSSDDGSLSGTNKAPCATAAEVQPAAPQQAAPQAQQQHDHAPQQQAPPQQQDKAPAPAKPLPQEFFTDCSEANRYVVRELIGRGSYGIVASATDRFTGERVAIKKITNVFEHVSDATRILREIKLLRLLRHPDIVDIKHIMLPPSPRDFKDIYVVFELMETDLHQVIKANDDLTHDHHQFFLYQMLRGLKYIHSAKVFHRDLKPKNILANSDCKLKICDFGLARPAFTDAPTAILWTDYVATRWYRAPELCGSFYAKYTPAIDVWSLGCIFAEVLLGKPLFPGKNVAHQLEIITDLLGTPPPHVLEKVRNDKARRFLQSMRHKPGIPFSAFFPRAAPGALALLRRMLAFDPSDRPTAEEALADPYFAGLHSPAREPVAQPISKQAFEFDRRKLEMNDVRELIYREILEYHPQALQAHLGQAPRSAFANPSALDNFKRQFMHLESNPGAIIDSRGNPIPPPSAAAAAAAAAPHGSFLPPSSASSAAAASRPACRPDYPLPPAEHAAPAAHCGSSRQQQQQYLQDQDRGSGTAATDGSHRMTSTSDSGAGRYAQNDLPAHVHQQAYAAQHPHHGAQYSAQQVLLQQQQQQAAHAQAAAAAASSAASALAAAQLQHRQQQQPHPSRSASSFPGVPPATSAPPQQQPPQQPQQPQQEQLLSWAYSLEAQQAVLQAQQQASRQQHRAAALQQQPNPSANPSGYPRKERSSLQSQTSLPMPLVYHDLTPATTTTATQASRYGGGAEPSSMLLDHHHQDPNGMPVVLDVASSGDMTQQQQHSLGAFASSNAAVVVAAAIGHLSHSVTPQQYHHAQQQQQYTANSAVAAAGGASDCSRRFAYQAPDEQLVPSASAAAAVEIAASSMAAHRHTPMQQLHQYLGGAPTGASGAGGYAGTTAAHQQQQQQVHQGIAYTHLVPAAAVGGGGGPPGGVRAASASATLIGGGYHHAPARH